MAKREAWWCFLLSVIFLFQSSAARAAELEILISFKAAIHDPLHQLSSWNASASFCDWNGVTCNSNSQVTVIELSGRNLSGGLSPDLFHLPFVRTINLSSNSLSGEIPVQIFSSSLQHLNLSNNNFSGPVSLPRRPLSNIETLDVSNNILSGEIPTEIRFFSGLKSLDFGGNGLSGKIPKSISELRNLQELTLASNELVGEIPPEIGQMTSLRWIYLGYNNLSGEIPTEIGNLSSLHHLDLVYNNLTGEIPSSFGNLTELRYLFLYQNRLSGWIPPSIFNLRNLVSLDLSDNLLSGGIPESLINLRSLEILHLFSNNLTGRIPESVSHLPHLKVLQLWSNRLSGQIPSTLGEKNNLTALDLSTNNLSGEIPDSLCNSSQLFKLILFSNSLSGKLPESLSRCKSLARVRLQNNHLSGQLPSELTKLPLVYYLDISGNELSGVIDDRKWAMPSLQMLNLARNNFVGSLPPSFGSEELESLGLSGNQFSGGIPASFGGFSKLVQLNLAKNQLSGSIPREISSCEKLVSLDVSNNQLSGHLPASLSLMPVLSELDLSHNRFSGELPQDLGKIDSLVSVNISYNNLHGPLPLTPAFLAVNSSAVVGNDGLCGGGTSSGLSTCKTTKRHVEWFFVSILVVLLLLFALSVFFFFFVRQGKDFQTKKVDNEEGVWDLQLFDRKIFNVVTVEDILLSLREENVVDKDLHGVSYRGTSAVEGKPFAVKKLFEIPSPSTTFWTETIGLAKIRHPNVVKTLGICHSETDGFVLYEFIEGRRFEDVVTELSWERRRKIATGIARALSFLHHRCCPAIIRGNLSAENVVIDGKGEARLKLNLPGNLAGDYKAFLSSGYGSPEIQEGQEFTEKSDVYALGVLMIELVTGKHPRDPEGGPQSTIVEWSRYCYSDCHLETWVDPSLRSHVSEAEKEIVQTMNLAVQCTALDPIARPTASDVLKVLQSSRKPNSVFSRLKNLYLYY
ncbi:leucine-rich repeat receptor-like serine/threonine-protein kinase SKM1 [Aristolochia californica]|uniref:leucine-rich repeat receptor-like serine/threonine-protein kinase SKM1 n=1 Tax=Aristolochia californica TaxID=171875 RepID=UPI0035D98EBF